MQTNFIMHDFEIKYKLLDNIVTENSFEDTWGEFQFSILGNNLCRYTKDGIEIEYTSHLFWVTEWLCKSAEYIMHEESFPISVSGSNSIELLRNSNILKFNLEKTNESQMLLLDQARFEWSFRHGWFASRGGSVLPVLFFRRVGDYMEISWDNASWLKHGIIYKDIFGCYYIQIGLFKKVVFEFLNCYFDEWEKNSLKRHHPTYILPEWRNLLRFFDAKFPEKI